MKNEKPTNVAASVRARLTNFSRDHGEEFQLVLTRYAIERFLYRLSVSEHGSAFILKGAMLFQLWADVPNRATRDLDLLGTGDSSLDRLTGVVRAVCTAPVPDDGLTFDPDTVTADRIREDQEYEGVRVTCLARLGQARIPLQIDVGFGDAVTPAPAEVRYPTLLDYPAPVLTAYPRATVIAEKFQAIVALGFANSRMKDFFDLFVLRGRFEFSGPEITRAIRATFRRRQTPIPSEPPLGVTPAFGADVTKKRQWEAFLRKGRLDAPAATLEEVCAALDQFLMPPARAAAEGKDFPLTWPAGGPWQNLPLRSR